MLRAALIGFAFQRQDHALSAHDERAGDRRAAHGKGETSIGISKVPDARLDRLTAMYNPQKRVPATVEFTDLAAQAGPAARRRSSTSRRTRTPTRSSTCCARFSDPAVPHPSGSIDPARDAQAMEDELILADLGVAERRLERLEKDLKKSRTAGARARARRRHALQGGARGRPAAARPRSEGRRSRSGCADSSFSPPSRCSS